MPPYSQNLKNPTASRPLDTDSEFLAALRADWGHPIRTPDGVEIRLPQFAFARLRALGLLLPNRNEALFQMSVLVYEFMHPDYEGLMGSLRRMLGVNIEGPEWLQCRCRSCNRREEDADKTPAPRANEPRPRGRYWLKVVRSSN